MDRLRVAGPARLLPHWRTVHHHFARWAADSTQARLHAVLRGRVRAAAGRTVTPTAAVIDSQSVRASDWVSRAIKGYDAAKKVHGRKPHVPPVAGRVRIIQDQRKRAAPSRWRGPCQRRRAVSPSQV